jgi:hypothetical protein
MKYRKVWELHNGPIPKDTEGRSYEIHHLDLDRTNNNIENLQCVSLQEHYEIHLKNGDYASAAFLKQKLGNPLIGWKHSEETKQKIRQHNLDNPRQYWLGKKRPDIALKQTGRIVSNETKQKQRNAKLNNPTKYWEGKKREGFSINKFRKCPHCGLEGNGGAMLQWHFDKCKFKK